MILVKSKPLFIIFGILLSLCLPFLSFLFLSEAHGLEDVQILRSPQIVPFIVVLEIFLYLFFGLLSGGAQSLYRLVQFSILMVFLRCVICVFDGLLVSAFREISQYNAILFFWLARPSRTAVPQGPCRRIESRWR